MRVLLFPASYTPVLGGLQTVVHNLAQYLLQHDHQVLVVTQRYPRSLPAQEDLDGVSVRRILFLRPSWEHLSQKQKRFDLFFTSFWFSLKATLQLRKIIQSFQPDVVNIHFPDAQLSFIHRFYRRRSFRYVISLHGHEITRWFNNGQYEETTPYSRRYQRELLSGALTEADAITTCSDHLLNMASQKFPQVKDKGVIIHNGVDFSRFQIAKKHPHAKPFLIAFGRFTFKKGFDLLLDAWVEATNEFSNFDLIIAGDGEQRVNLEAQSVQLGLSDRVFFCGRANEQEIVALLRSCSAVIIPSREEPFGIVALEALAAGKPIVSTKVGGLNEIFHNKGKIQKGINSLVELVEPDVTSLAKGLKSILSTLTGSQQKADNSDFLSNYTWGIVGEKYERVLKGEKSVC